jgi:hypothetical protein
MTRYKHRMDTMDGPIEWEDDIPPTPVKTPEERAEELDRIYPHPNKASYLRYKCHYCTEEYFLISPYREKGKNPYNEGFMVKPEVSKLKNVVFACRSCLLDLHNRRESVWINGYKDG